MITTTFTSRTDVGTAGTLSASVVICAYTEQRWADIVHAVAGVAAQMPAPLEVLLVIDHNAALAERARRELRGVHVLENQGVRGLSGARDTGARAAAGDIIVFLDDDACARQGWLAGLCSAFDDPTVVMAGGRVEPAWDADVPSWYPEEFGWVFGCSYTGLPTVAATIRNPIGASMAVRRSTVEQIGGFTGSLGRVGADTGGCEETEYAIRATTTLPGTRVAYVPDAIVDHRVPVERATLGYFVRRCHGEGRSKARLVRLADPGVALESERQYLTRTLPLGVCSRLRHVREWGAAAAIALGVAATAVGYAQQRLPSRSNR
jgi:glucosyl-dolichyl phosphate glucuronosyltransferase